MIELTNNVKIVIWDLDETFWRGTLSEGRVEKIPTNIEMVRKLVDRGIMCSIVSKNDFHEAFAVLEKWDIGDYFIFPRISWHPKGEQIKELLRLCALRAENALFIDDNLSNLKEAEFYNPGIMTSLPDILADGYLLKLPQLSGKNDKSHSRLKQYKILEARTEKQEMFSSNEEFLRSSSIRIAIIEDCLPEKERIIELIARTNQLNYTKLRSTEAEIDEILVDNQIKTGFVKVKDNFGDYGIVGFYAIKEGKLLHFLFSCRILGFGIEHYLWRKLGYPAIETVGDVATVLNRKYAEHIDWISEAYDNGEVVSDVIQNKQQNILILGGCDLNQACVYLEGNKYKLTTEFNTVVDGFDIKRSDSLQLLNGFVFSDECKRELCDNLPVFSSGITFQSHMFSGEYSTVIYSVVDDYIRGVWRHKQGGYKFSMGGYFDQDNLLHKFSPQQLAYLRDNFTFEGRLPAQEFEKNLRQIIDRIGVNVHIILINGIDIDVSDWIGQDRVDRNREMNAVVDKVAYDYANVDICDMRKIVTSRDVLTRRDNRHYDRKTYYRMAMELARLCGGDGEVRLKGKFEAKMGKLIASVKRKMGRFH